MNWSEVDIPAWARIKTRRPNIEGLVPLVECVDHTRGMAAVPVADFCALMEAMGASELGLGDLEPSAP